MLDLNRSVDQSSLMSKYAEDEGGKQFLEICGSGGQMEYSGGTSNSSVVNVEISSNAGDEEHSLRFVSDELDWPTSSMSMYDGVDGIDFENDEDDSTAGDRRSLFWKRFGYLYNEAAGDPSYPITPGSLFEKNFSRLEMPNIWCCPVHICDGEAIILGKICTYTSTTSEAKKLKDTRVISCIFF